MNNLIIVNKPVGISSNKTIQIIKKRLKLKKIGHCGTLDPNASGVLVCLTNDSTKLASKYSNEKKYYQAKILFGILTDSYDIEGDIIEQNNDLVDIKILKKLISDFNNTNYYQTPPIFSAKKVNGMHLYEYARKRQLVNIQPNEVTIFNCELVSFNKKERSCTINLTVSKGFYVRSFCVDLAKKMNNIATLYSLIRTRSGSFSLDDATDFHEIYELNNKVKTLNTNFDFNSINTDNLVIGHFDIFHKSHEKLFIKDKKNCVITFVNNPSKNNFYYSSTKIKILSSLPYVDNVLVFDIRKNNCSYEYFIKNYLQKMNFKTLTVGVNFKFGKDNKGKINHLSNLFNLNIIENDDISSTKIKKFLKEGSFYLANQFLTEDLFFLGYVVHGKKLARKIGFPTANILYKSNVEIRPGSYSSKVQINNIFYDSISFIKKYDDLNYIIESHIFNFDKIIYGYEIKVYFYNFIRAPSEWSSESELKQMIINDINDIKNKGKYNELKNS